MRNLAIAVVLVGGTAGAAPKATVEHGEASVTGAVEPAAVVKLVKGSSAKLLACYKKALVIRPGLAGTVTATFTIGGDGKVVTASAIGLTTSATACMAATITKLRFAKPKDGQPAKVTYPLTFDPGPAGGSFAALGGGIDTSEMNRGVGIGRGGAIGTIGETGGTGRGYVTSRAPRDVPTVMLGVPTVQGGFDKAVLRRYFKRNFAKLRYCYEKALLAAPTLKGTVVATFTIGGDGLVSASAAKGVGNQSLEACVAAAIRSIEFAKPKGNRAVTVTYPLTFQPAAPVNK